MKKQSFWTPCKHFKQCIGYCPYCIKEYCAGVAQVAVRDSRKVEDASSSDAASPSLEGDVTMATLYGEEWTKEDIDSPSFGEFEQVSRCCK